MRVKQQYLRKLIRNKLIRSGLSDPHADIVTDVLVFADLRGVHSHGAVRVEYYVERLCKGGINTQPNYQYQQTSTTTAVLDADNGAGHVAAKMAMEKAIAIAKEHSLAAVGIRRMSHSGALAYFTDMAARQDLIAISCCQSDPMAAPFGASESFFGTNPISFAAPTNDERLVLLDMATSVQAWGKILHARAKHQEIPPTWAVDSDGVPTSNPMKVNALMPIAGPKGSGLMMMVDILSGLLLGLPFGKHVSSMYSDLSQGRELGQLHLVLNPAAFTDLDLFKERMSLMLDEFGDLTPAPGHDQVLYPGELEKIRQQEYEANGVEIVDDLYDYLVSDELHFDRYHGKNKFAESET